MDLITVWFGLIVFCWVMFFVLEGFDFGVGLLAPILGRDEHERGAAIRTVGPFWDGNEVWLVGAVGLTFGAFPDWYAAMMSGLYLPMVLLLLLLAGRGVALEFRGKHDDPRWRRRCETALAVCSASIVLVWGAILAGFVRGLALGADGEVASSGGTFGGLARTLRPVLGWPAGLGAGLALFAAVLLGATFLGLRSTGPLRRRARRLAVTLASVGAGSAGLTALFATVLFATGWSVNGLSVNWRLIAIAALLAVVCAGLAVAAWSEHEALAFALTMLAVAGAVIAVFTWNGAVVLPSTLDPAWSLTRSETAATDSALRLLSVVGVVVLPGILVYQTWSYWVFRSRVSSERLA
jgi:cytochrome bd ubiquinol oxidase subunit II